MYPQYKIYVSDIPTNLYITSSDGFPSLTDMNAAVDALVTSLNNAGHTATAYYETITDTAV